MSSWLPADWAKTIVLILQKGIDGQGKDILFPIGTSFLFGYDGLNCLITAKHVIFTKDGQLKKDVVAAVNKVGGGMNLIPLHTLVDTHKIGWSFHDDPEVDLAVIPIAIDTKQDDVKKMPMTLFETFDNISEGDEVFFLGFPLGIVSPIRVNPIVRGGIIASKRDNKTFLIDANVFPGNSGSPVFLRPTPFIFTPKGITIGKVRDPKFLGIISSYIPYIDKAISPQTGRVRVTFEENSALGVVYSTRYIEEMLSCDNFQKTFQIIHKKVIQTKED